MITSSERSTMKNVRMPSTIATTIVPFATKKTNVGERRKNVSEKRKKNVGARRRKNVGATRRKNVEKLRMRDGRREEEHCIH